MENAKIHNCEQNCAKLGVNVYFFHSKQHSKLPFWDLRPLKTALKTDFCDKNQVKSQNPVVAKFQKWPRMLRIDPLDSSRGLVSFQIFLLLLALPGRCASR